MSRRLFEALSAELAQSRPVDRATGKAWAQWVADVAAVVRALSSVNKAFDAERFKRDCNNDGTAAQPHCEDHRQFEYDCLDCSDALVKARGR